MKFKTSKDPTTKITENRGYQSISRIKIDFNLLTTIQLSQAHAKSNQIKLTVRSFSNLLIVNISSFYSFLNSHFVKHDAESDVNRHSQWNIFHRCSFFSLPPPHLNDERFKQRRKRVKKEEEEEED